MGGGRGKGRKQERKQKGSSRQGLPVASRGRKSGDWQGSPSWKEFTAQLEGLGLVLRDTQGDGNCLFRSLSDQIYGSEAKHPAVRKALMDFMVSEPDEFAPFLLDEVGELQSIQSYCARMGRSGEWGGNLELVAASRVYQRHIVVHRLNEPRMEIRNWRPRPESEWLVDVPEAPDVLHCAFYDGDHYASVRALADRASHRPAARVQLNQASKMIGSGRFTTAESPSSQESSGLKKKIKIVSEQTGCRDSELMTSVLQDTMGDVDAAVEVILALQEHPQEPEEDLMMEDPSPPPPSSDPEAAAAEAKESALEMDLELDLMPLSADGRSSAAGGGAWRSDRHLRQPALGKKAKKEQARLERIVAAGRHRVGKSGGKKPPQQRPKAVVASLAKDLGSMLI